MSVCLSVGIEQLGSNSTDFNEIWHFTISWKSFEKIQVSLKSDKITGTLHEEQYILCFLLGNSPASEFFMSMFRNPLSCSVFIGRQVGVEFYTYLPIKSEQTEGYETWT
jgi:hypothetical protein